MSLVSALLNMWTLRNRGGSLLHLDCDHQAHLLEINVPGIGSSIPVELNNSTAGSLSLCTIKGTPQSTKSLPVSNCAANDRRGYEVQEWFAPFAAQFDTGTDTLVDCRTAARRAFDGA